MYSWLIVLLVNMMIIAVVSMVLMKHSRYRSIKPLLFVLVAALLFGGIWLSAQNHLSERAICNAAPVMEWEQCPLDDKNIYYDEEEGSYFFVTYDDWEFFPMFHRNYLDPIQAAELVNLTSQLEQYNIDNMILEK